MQTQNIFVGTMSVIYLSTIVILYSTKTIQLCLYEFQQKGQGLGVVGVVEVDFLEPIHNKQDFMITNRYKWVGKRFIHSLSTKTGKVIPLFRSGESLILFQTRDIYYYYFCCCCCCCCYDDVMEVNL